MNDSVAAQSNGTSAGEQLTLTQFYEKYVPAALAIDRMVTPVFYFIGIPCNPLCAFIWLGQRTRRSNSSAIYLGTLSISHSVFLILHIFIELNYAWDIKTFDGYVSCELFYTVYYYAQYMAPLLVLSFTVERYIAICHPFLKEKYCTVGRAVVVVFTLLFFCLLLSCVQAYLWTYDEHYKVCNHRQHLQATNFPLYWTWITELTVFGVAPFAALVFNVFVIREIRNITSRGPAGVLAPSGSGQNQASTMTLLSISFYLICTWLPATLVYSLEQNFPVGDDDPQRSPVWRRHFTYITVRKCVEEVTLSNSACYFFIYYLTGKFFRVRFQELMCPKKCVSGAGRGEDFAAGSMNGRSAAAKQYIAVPCKSDTGYSSCATNV
ncbi:growth hormone secretagogue receptor type 1-like [Babylonia areolata]|uniref:growth hormone secretagogue receptor type 1-like n=1 Tax=Babylonia areolata TaxID=304850 RepID=UPI003FD37EB1